MTRLVLAVVAAIAVALLGCGGGGAPSVRIVFEADVSQPPASGVDGALKDLADNLNRRAVALGASDIEVQVEDQNQLSVSLSGLSIDDARELLSRTARLEIRQAVLDVAGQIVCEYADGSRVTVAKDRISYAAIAGSGAGLPKCVDSQRVISQVVWEPAMAGGTEQGPVLTGAFIRPNGAVVDRTETPVLIVNLTDEGSALLAQISEGLVGLPLGVFIDDKLMAGPTVKETITTGNLAIAGLSARAAEILAAQLNTGVLPLPIRELSAQ